MQSTPTVRQLILLPGSYNVQFVLIQFYAHLEAVVKLYCVTQRGVSNIKSTLTDRVRLNTKNPCKYNKIQFISTNYIFKHDHLAGSTALQKHSLQDY